jgi:hypothetical protein
MTRNEILYQMHKARKRARFFRFWNNEVAAVGYYRMARCLVRMARHALPN